MPNPCALIGSFSVRILQFGPFPCIFVLERSRQIQNLQPKQRKKKVWIICHSSHWNYQKKLKRLKFFRNFKDRWRRQTFLSASHRKCILLSETECHIINNLLTELARAVLANIGPRSRQYGPCFAWMSCKCAFECTRFNWGVNCRNKKCRQNFSVFATLCFQIACSLIIYLCLFTSYLM